MSGVEGFFHNAHEVYAKVSLDDDWTWIGTLQTKALAESVAAAVTGHFTKVVPV